MSASEWQLPEVPTPIAKAFAAWRRTFSASVGPIAIHLEDRWQFTGAFLAALAAEREVVVPGDALPATLRRLEQDCSVFALAPQEDAPPAPIGPLAPHRCVVRIFTSGSTGEAIASIKPLSCLLDEVVALESVFGASLPRWATVHSTVSHQHLYGLLFAVVWPLSMGRGIAQFRHEYPETLKEALQSTDSVLVASPAHLKRLPDGGPAWETQVRAVFSSGGPLGDEAADRVERVLGLSPIEVYGSTETGGIAFRTRPALEWQPFPGVGWRLSTDGVLEIQSPFLGHDGWFTTSDKATPSGATFRLAGRNDRIAKIEEKRVSLDAIERVLTSTEWCTEVRLVVLTSRRIELGAVCVLSEKGNALLRGAGRRALTTQLKRALSTEVEPTVTPRRFRFVEKLPTNEQGKTTRQALSGLFRPEHPDIENARATASSAQFEFSVSPDLRVLDGHFPSVPIVPGVAQLHWAVLWADQFFECGRHVVRVEALKFYALMRPHHRVSAQLSFDAARRSMSFLLKGTHGSYSSGRILFADRGALALKPPGGVDGPL
jgi:3-hydroxymyristoyl/3-hydroxydecanoyl-(acyl carrier protein) dehydratase